ncbi:MAG: CTP synthase [Candidatus Dojkabacteria bacterium]|uniref:CTP synthase (glutamine hydrolyzing) n=1 Tax=Candidatus Dojkabacteria bacterium TaxID=2099670 RepID=A0A952ALX1_9BACT|nr:CTP synthase [Candidatus Dojkabacteria bacterium]WKZ28284.1 MAG: CTP synthase [Candidatus Dojkabacteria bacterium]
MKKQPVKYIFISGGVLSGLGKGVCASSLGILLQKRGFKVGVIKCETYLNVDSGTINPIEHGDPFLCEDGLEADMDLGTYERFLDIEVGRKNFLTMGMVYQTIIQKERSMGYEGKTVDAIPHIPEEIIKNIKNAGEGNDICIVELGGTVGEYQNIFNIEAARIMKLNHPADVIHVHLSYVPVPKHLGEPKTKPTQLSIRLLNSAGIQPEFLVVRSEVEIDRKRRDKLAINCNVNRDNIINNPDLDNIYELPGVFRDQEFHKKVMSILNLKPKKKRTDLRDWQLLVKRVKSKFDKEITVAIAGKYFATGDYELPDSYISLIHAIKHACWYNKIDLNLKFINTEEIENRGIGMLSQLKPDGIIVPIGWGKRGVEGKISAIELARTNKIPYLGLCYGMQLAAVEYARNVCGLKDAHTEEVDPSTQNPIIHSIPFNSKYQTIKGEGVSMRLGAFDCVIKKGSLAEMIYNKHNGWKDKRRLIVSERHRHRFEFNNDYRSRLENQGFIVSGASPDDFFVEMIELDQKEHPFFFATQAHPEYKSRPLNPHPIFLEFTKAALKNKAL